MNLIKYLTILLIFTLTINRTYSQDQDAGMWNTFSIEKRITKKISIDIDEEFRLKENFTRLNLFYTNFGINYKLSKTLKVGLIYRLIEKYNDDDHFSYRNRLMLDINYKYKIKAISISYRSRLQSEVRNYYTSEKGKIPEWYWRNKFEIKYNLNKIDPYIGTELRFQIKDPRNPITDMGWHRVRIFGGVDYKINKNNTCGIYYLVQREWLVLNPQNLHILGLEYSISIP